MADEQPRAKDKTKKAKDKKQARTAGRSGAEQPSTALAASPTEQEPADDRLQGVLDTIASNELTLGELTLSYPSRDVVLVLDGLTAARVIAAFADPARRSSLQDELNAASSMRTCGPRSTWTGCWRCRGCPGCRPAPRPG